MLVYSRYSDIIHGRDSRRDIFELDSTNPGHQLVRQAATGVGMLVSNQNLYYDGSSAPRLETNREAIEACKGDQKFIDQPKFTGVCATAFLINERHVVTAGHVVNTRSVSELTVVFRYYAEPDWRDHVKGDSKPYQLERAQLARVDYMLYCSASAPMGDLAVLHLADAVDPRVAVPLQIAPRQSLRNGPGISMIGHPRGLPCKAVVGDVDLKGWPLVWSYDSRSAQTNVDTFQANSGSPLLDPFGRVIGVMSSLPSPHEPRRGCIQVLPETPGTAWCSRIDLIADLLENLGIPGI